MNDSKKMIVFINWNEPDRIILAQYGLGTHQDMRDGVYFKTTGQGYSLREMLKSDSVYNEPDTKTK